MLEVEFTIRGKKVKPDDVKNRTERAIMIEVERSLRQRVGNIRCSEHDAAPIIKASGASVEALEFDLAGCCQPLIDRIVRALG